MALALIGDWGADLDDESFACALAWLLTHEVLERPGDELASARRRGYIPSGAAWWSEVGSISAASAAQSWSHRTAGTASLGIAVVAAGLPADLDPAQLVRALRHAPGVDSVFFLDEHEPLLRSPLRPPKVVVFEGMGQVPQALAEDPLLGGLELVTDSEGHSGRVDLFVFGGALDDAPRWFAGRQPSPIDSLLVFDDMPGQAVIEGLGKTRRTAHAHAAALVGLDVRTSRAKQEWLSRFLTHWRSQVSFARALFEVGGGIPVLLAGPAGFAPRAIEERFMVRPRDADDADEADEGGSDPPKRLRKMRGGGGPPRRTRGVRAKPPEKSESEPEHAENVDGRMLQARLCEAGQQESVNDQALREETGYRLDVRVARPARGWVGAPVAFPSDKLPPAAEGHWLDVVLVAADVWEEPQQAKLLLPPLADSQPCSFALPIPARLARLNARVTVLYQNRILQTVRVSAPIGEKQAAEDGLKIELEAVLRASLGDVSQTSGFDLALLFNDAEGVPGVTAFGGDEPAYVNLQGNVDDLRKTLRAALEGVTRNPSAFQDPKSEETRKLYLTLARAGRGFLTALSELPRMKAVLQRLGAAGRLQVTSLHPDDLTPLELIYEGPFPKKTAQLCPALLGKHACDDACVASEDVICASKFWGLRHVIERRLFDEHASLEVQQQGAVQAFQAEVGVNRPSLPALRTVLCAAAQRAASFDEASFTATMGELEVMLSAAQGQLVRVDGWAGWATQVAQLAPQLLLLIAHTEPALGAIELEIGKQDCLAAEEIKDQHVWVAPPAPPNPGPIVLLFGCRTAEEEVPFSSFIAAFRRAHASVIIGTLSTVLGRHMAPVAKRTINLLMERSSGTQSSVGEVLRDLRRALVAEALPVGLTLVSFGEADWRIGGGA